jgi:1-acyl-sn-glycerol-3-phosphate acyltransferase
MDEWRYQPARDAGLSPTERARSLRRESGLLESGGHLLWGALVRYYLAVYHRMEVRGREHVPARPPFVLVANHSSHLDALALASFLPWRLRDRVFPVAAGDVFFETPAVSHFASWFINALPLWRKNACRHALGELRARLVEEPCVFILFPEGARANDGKLMPFKHGLGMMIAGTGVPVVPCYLRGAYEAAPKGKVLPRPVKLRVDIGPPLVFEGVPNERQGWQEIGGRLEAAVKALGGIS